MEVIMGQQSKIIVPLPGKGGRFKEKVAAKSAYEDQGSPRGFHPGNEHNEAVDPPQPPSGIFT